MNYIEAPTEYEGSEPALFLAGGVSDAENWQRRLLRLLPRGEYAVLNPRRVTFPADDTAAETQQIEWEVRHLRRAMLAVFWFPAHTLCPITLLELGACWAAEKPIVVGADVAYARRFDMEIHLRLQRPDVTIADTLELLATQVANCRELKDAFQ